MDGQYELFRAASRSSSKRDGRQQGRINLILSGYTVTRLAEIFQSLSGQARTPGQKARLLEQLSVLLDLQSREDYEAFAARLPARLREILERAVFEDWIPLDELARYGIKIEQPDRLHFYDPSHFPPDSRLGCFVIDRDGGFFALEPWLRELFFPFLPKPAGWQLAPLVRAPDETWSAADSIADSLPLFRRKLKTILSSTGRFELAHRGLNKTLRSSLRAASGLPAFGAAGLLGLDSSELVARFLALFDVGVTEANALDRLKVLVGRFFSGVPRQKERDIRSAAEREAAYAAGYADSYFEQEVFLDHLSRRPGFSLAAYAGVCPARQDFRRALDALGEIERASPGAWVDARALFDCLWLHLASFRITDEAAESGGLGLKAERLTLRGRTEKLDQWEHSFQVTAPRRRELIARPIFEQYVYLFAALGLVEIAEGEPPRPLVRKKQACPISPADCLAALRLTPLGRWCLGYSEERPLAQAGSFEAIADAELLLVTFKGSSLERRLYLDGAATPIGPERWRFSEARFIEGCESPAAIEARIADFLRLIDREPSPRWLAFFEAVRTRAAVVPALEAAYVLPLPPDPAIRRLFSEQPKIRSLAHRVEDGSVVIRAEDLPALAKLLRAEGFWVPDLRKARRQRDVE